MFAWIIIGLYVTVESFVSACKQKRYKIMLHFILSIVLKILKNQDKRWDMNIHTLVNNLENQYFDIISLNNAFGAAVDKYNKTH